MKIENIKKVSQLLTSIFVIVIVFIGAFCLTGCKSEYAGSYKVISYIDSEINVTSEQYHANPSNYDEWDIFGWFEMTIKLKANGKFEQHQESSSYVQKGSWNVYGDKIKLTVDNELYFEFTIVNDSTFTFMPYIEYGDDTTLTLSKI